MFHMLFTFQQDQVYIWPVTAEKDTILVKSDFTIPW